ncbi:MULTISPECIES: biotin--[acetyl-CoA-carboxylase] ligase [Methanobacterium]|jgi:BirA family biotin operon repressor/biotin-[acetyl-CoA-carboxylase] ligase|uniref:Biotin--[acetyl-CoA-carboxylase] ligase n=2 Tax=Methanobacterium subterraneum TaxID=59277 RepID=A0A2H4VPP9_9EURY|nr:MULTISPECIES: biotin--[acetyl-CoA-carboxylase] ligase [Methanobacterium]MBW4257788.1 biotin--[acetyl-CoA-carboxylase] ligase [Methanobacterium sp. YSL]AUB56923.1 biotin--[acetyl-CoA-carboxylase] ligase [Methanobacterium sp. MZ-A1]AUB60078.1 biotin--[acetyl-CoA-carboxylase] ligase [Methanobacterium subterraneum]MCC7560280.1 biotin--[acetyl-CoA-carboxylase] ligase [Methanobacterium sp.]NMO10207.1 biotin--[acetyl-CoA-carboxylase] ligase [Methanobacterium subterraneum]
MHEKQILKTLHAQKGEYVSSDNLASKMGISNAQLSDEIQKLQNDGYRIDSSSERGYRLIKTTNRLLPYEIQLNLTTKYIGQEIYHYSEVDSTNNVAKELAEKGAVEGTIVIAESQRRGKGRRGKKWLSPSGGVWMTIILRPDIPTSQAPLLTLLTGVAVAETLTHECGLDVGIKWPNDILIGDKKVCGILTEAIARKGGLDYVVVGIGIDLNVDVDEFPPDLRKGATSLKNELEKEIPGEKLVQNFLLNFENLYQNFKEGQLSEILNQWRSLSTTIGSTVEVKKRGGTIRGEAVGITRDGILILEMDDGSLRKIISGECTHYKR